jgi:hypothetical protein
MPLWESRTSPDCRDGDATFPDRDVCSKSILSITGDAEDFSETGLAFTDSFKS